jgi:predicted nuclease of restriction endonuclease-like (RecB) superfamily
LRISLSKNKTINLLPLGWSHYLFLLRIDNEVERQFYEVESYKNQWKLKELERQFNSGLFERLSLSKNKDEIITLAKKGQIVEKPEDVIKDPLILEFLGLDDKPKYTETDLETAIINKIEDFMMDLGKGFFFGGRQVRFTFDEEHFFVDLVFYNRLLKCFVLIDLKIGKLKHQDLGQMQMYVNYYDRYVKQEDENPSIGIIICKHKKETMVEITLPENNKQLFASKYQTILPSKKELKQIIENNL